jgi:hypothetical protein
MPIPYPSSTGLRIAVCQVARSASRSSARQWLARFSGRLRDRFFGTPAYRAGICVHSRKILLDIHFARSDHEHPRFLVDVPYNVQSLAEYVGNYRTCGRNEEVGQDY